MRIVHISDIHLCLPYRWTTLRGKRIAGGLNWLLKRQWRHRRAVWDAFVEATVADPPDVLVCTGDVSQLGAAAELTLAAAGLARIAAAGAQVLYAPGNHDNYVAADPEADRVRADLCRRYGGDGADAPVRVKRIGAVEFILLDQTAPMGLTRSSGRMPPAAWKELERLGAEPRLGDGERKAVRIVPGHFPLLRRDGHPLRPKRALEDAEQLVHLLDALDADLYLCGHLHSDYEIALRGGTRQIAVGSLTDQKSVNVIDLTSDELRTRKTIRSEL